MRGAVGIAVVLAVGLLLPAGAAARRDGARARAARAVAAAGGFPVSLSSSVPVPVHPGAAYDDPAGDAPSGLAPDVGRTTVWSDADGIVTFAVEIPNVPAVRSGDFFALFLDTDEDASTGSPAAGGADYALALHGATGTVGLARWRAGAWDFTTPHASLAGAWAFGPSLRIDRAELGGTAAFRFWSGASWTDTAGHVSTDLAPGAGAWAYRLPGVEPQPPVADTLAPAVRALRSKGRVGGVAALRFRLADDSGYTRERIRVFRAGGRLLWTLRTTLARSRAGVVYWVPWQAPGRVGTRLRFCVRAWDEAGNGSRPSCAPLRLQRRS